MKTITVNLAGGRGYPVLVGSGILAAQAAQHAAPVNILITHPPLYDLYGKTLQAQLEAAGKKVFALTVPDGEASKSMPALQDLLGDMLATGMGRDGCVIALGGGVIGDLAGFAAAVYMRGVPAVQLPTTLLAQVDAAIGGKTGVNHAAGKNLIGAFHQPRAVIADTAVLASLPPREYRAGLAEVVKYGLLGDAEFFAYLEDSSGAIGSRDADALQHIIGTSAQMKADIVAADETEQSGRRALLNLGHTFAHALEAVCGYGALLHGEAVAIGLVAAAALSEKICGFSAADTARIRKLLAALQLPTQAPENIPPARLLEAMGMDKKNSGGEKRFILMRRIGEAFVGAAPDRAVLQTLEELQ